MKTILFSAIFALGFAANGYSHNGDEHGDKYCAQTKDGKTTITHQGSVITADVALDNGSVLKMDGTLIKKDGTKISLKEGECVTHEGKIVNKKEYENKKEPK